MDKKDYLSVIRKKGLKGVKSFISVSYLDLCHPLVQPS